MSGYEDGNALSTGKRSAESADFIGEGSSLEGSKKQRVVGPDPGQPSLVLHVRSLPYDCTDADLMALICPFGRVIRTLLLKGKNQGFVQLEDLNAATSAMQYYARSPAQIRGRTVYLQYSSRNEITSQASPETPNHVILVTILNVLYPITVDVLEKVFFKHAPILKIVVFQKGALQALIQFATTSHAAAARDELDGKNIYDGCCTLKIQFSNLTDLNVKFNNDRSRDFTNPTLPAGPPTAMSGLDQSSALGMYTPNATQMYGGWGMAPGQPQGFLPGMGGGSASFNGMMPKAPMSSGCVLIVGGFAEGTDCDTLMTLFGIYGDVSRVKIMYNKQDTALVQFTTAQGAETAMAYLNGFSFRGQQLKVHVSKHNSIMMNQNATDEEASRLTKDYSNSPKHRYRVIGSKNFQHITPPTCVLHVSNLPDDATEESVQELFCHCGVVTAVKMFPKERRMALVQYTSPEEAIEGLVAFHQYSLHGHQIRVSFSKSNI